MKHKINLAMIAISMLAVCITMFSITCVYYNLFGQQVKKDLRIQARILAAAGLSKLTDEESLMGDPDIRITWISAKGEVLFDNDARNLDNHLDRPEVRDAFLNGVGESVRESDTMNMRTFYYAVLLEDGTEKTVRSGEVSVRGMYGYVE